MCKIESHLLKQAISVNKLKKTISSSNPQNLSKGTKSYHTSSNNYKLNPYYVSGFSDAEASFTISIVERSYLKLGWGVSPIFTIQLHSKELPLLQKLKSYFGGVGNITVQNTENRNSATYSVSSIKDLNNVIIPLPFGAWSISFIFPKKSWFYFV